MTSLTAPRIRLLPAGLLLCCALGSLPPARAGELYEQDTEFLKLVYYSKDHEYLAPHLMRSFENSLAFHRKLFDYTPSESIVVLLQDFGDYGHGGTSTVPWNYISIGLEPFDYVYETMPANERMNWLMHHELVHVVATDQPSTADRRARKFFHGKVAPTAEDPVSMYYSYLTSPRWYAPRWYHEGIAVFLETWMAGGLGRVLGGYDEMVFRTRVLEDRHFYDIVGLESEGTAIDFQVGQNSYLYGTRFMTYLGLQYGPEKLIRWVNRDDGSKRRIFAQFQNVYGNSLHEEWRRWIAWEKEWQQANLERVRQYPTTQGTPILDRGLGSLSRPFFDAAGNRLIAAVNYPGESAHIATIDLETGRMRKLAGVDGSALYYVTSLAYDAERQKIFFTTDNSRGWRDLNELDLRTEKRKVLIKNCRTGDLVLNPRDHSIWGVQHHNGLSSVVRFVQPYEEWETLLTLPYGKDVFDIDISPDGRSVSAAIIEINGRQRLVHMETEKLLAGDGAYDVLFEFENNSPANFVFSPDGRYLFGSSYYSGVSNIFRYDFERKEMEAVTNAETGFFRPLPLNAEELIAFRYAADGFVPVRLKNEVLEDVSAIRYLGQEVVERHDVVTTWNAGSPARVDLSRATLYQGEYKNRLRLASAYPVLQGYRDELSYGWHFNLADPAGLHQVGVMAGYSPTRDLPSSERYHGSVEYNHYPWSVRATHNNTDFYDLFGPTKTSRKGTSLGADFEGFIINESPKTMTYSIGLTGWRGLDTLPDYQDVAASFDKYLTARFNMKYSRLRRTIGAVESEKGLAWGFGLSNNYVNSSLQSRAYTNLDVGVPLPLDHSSLWFRSSLGHSFGDENNSFANFYFGGFGNNWVDHGSVRRYRDYYSFPGVDLSSIEANNYGKLLVEWTLPAVKFRRLGSPGFYVNWMQFTLFGSGITTNFNRTLPRRELANVGLQVDFKMVLFANLESTLSLGYAQAFESGSGARDEFMGSLKILH